MDRPSRRESSGSGGHTFLPKSVDHNTDGRSSPLRRMGSTEQMRIGRRTSNANISQSAPCSRETSPENRSITIPLLNTTTESSGNDDYSSSNQKHCITPRTLMRKLSLQPTKDKISSSKLSEKKQGGDTPQSSPRKFKKGTAVEDSDSHGQILLLQARATELNDTVNELKRQNKEMQLRQEEISREMKSYRDKPSNSSDIGVLYEEEITYDCCTCLFNERGQCVLF